MADEDDRGEACYFYRDLKRGSYGGDVSCLQQFLRAEVRVQSLQCFGWNRRNHNQYLFQGLSTNFVTSLHFLKGLLFDEPSGYFGTATEDALVKWQVRILLSATSHEQPSVE